MRLRNVNLKLTGRVDGRRGWNGDVKNMLLDIAKISARAIPFRSERSFYRRYFVCRLYWEDRLSGKL